MSMSIPAFIESTEGLITAIAGLMTGLAALLTAWRQFRLASNLRAKVDVPRSPRAHRYLSGTAVVGIFFVVVSASMLIARAFSQGPKALNIELTAAAWEAFNKNDFVGAIANADKCVGEFRGAADREQAKLENSKVPLPPTGAVSEADKKTILDRGLLNDVATCLYIKGRSAENLGRKEDAKQAYELARKYTYARCWDPKGWFWSPAEAATDRLTMLK